MKKRKNCATGGSLDPSSMLSVLGPLLGTVNPVLGAVPQLMQQYINKQKQDAIVVSATPGNYNYGGPVYPPVQQSMLPAPFPIESTYVNTLVNPLMSLATSPLTREELWRDSRQKVYGKDIYTATTKVGTEGSSHSKSRGRMSFADGGQMDAPLASDSFQVKGHPNKTDGNYYPEYNANLDHNEVVKDSFVFSDKLKIGKDSFAKLAKIIETSTGKAEKALKINPEDTAALNTIKHNEVRSAALAAKQEQQATAMGLRDNSRNFASGGPTDPPYSLYMPEWDRSKNSISRNFLMDPYYWNPIDATTGKRRKVYTPDDMTGDIPEAGHSLIDLGRDNMYFDPYKQQIVVRNKKGFYVPVKPREGDFVRDNAGNIIDQTTGRSFNPQAHMAYDANPTIGLGAVAATAPTAAPNNTSVVDSSSRAKAIESLTVPPVAPPVSGPGGGGGPRQQRVPMPTNFPGAPRNPNYVDPQMDLYVNGNTEKYSPVATFNQLPSQYGAKQTYPVNNITTPDGEIVDIGQLGPSNGVTSPGLYQNFAKSNRSITAPALPNIDTSKTLGFDQATFNAATPGATGSGNPNKWATGDYLQAAKVLSGFGQLLGGSEREKPNYDNTQITQSVYDPNQALMQNQRTYKDSLAGFDAPSINTRRAYDNALYANKLGQDNQVISQYAQMNQQGRQQYEQRTADQRRYNVGQTTYTNDINARNRAAYKEAVDTAFTGLSNFGVGLNQKKQGYDTLGILKTMYPDVYANIMKSLNGN